MKPAHAACVAGVAAVEAAARAINASAPAEFERGSGASAEAPVRRSDAERRRTGAAIHASEARRRRAGNMRLRHLCCRASRFRSTAARLRLMLEPTAPQPAAPPRPASTFKPATLVEAPLCVGRKRLASGRIAFTAPPRGGSAGREPRPIETSQEAQSESAAASQAELAPEETVEEIEESDQLPSEAESRPRGKKPNSNLEDEFEEDEFDEDDRCS